MENTLLSTPINLWDHRNIGECEYGILPKSQEIKREEVFIELTKNNENGNFLIRKSSTIPNSLVISYTKQIWFPMPVLTIFHTRFECLENGNIICSGKKFCCFYSFLGEIFEE
jgi:hypothetical protein